MKQLQANFSSSLLAIWRCVHDSDSLSLPFPFSSSSASSSRSLPAVDIRDTTSGSQEKRHWEGDSAQVYSLFSNSSGDCIDRGCLPRGRLHPQASDSCYDRSLLTWNTERDRMRERSLDQRSNTASTYLTTKCLLPILLHHPHHPLYLFYDDIQL